MTDDTRPLLRVLVIVAVIETLSRAIFLALGSPPLLKDPIDYWTIAAALGEGDWLVRAVPVAHRTPGYPLFLIPFQLVLGDHALFGIALAQQALGAITHLLATWLVWRATRSVVSVSIAYLFLVTTFASTYAANLVFTETLYRFLIAVLALLAMRHVRRPSLAAAGALGVTLGALTLVRPVAQLLVVPIAAVVLTIPWPAPGTWREALRDRAQRAAVVVLACGVLLVPWLARNHAIFSEPFLTKFMGRSAWRAAFLSYARNYPIPDTPEAERILADTGLAEGDPGLRHNWTVFNLLEREHGEIEAEDLMFTVARQALLANFADYVLGTPKHVAVFFAARSFPIVPTTEHAAGGEWFGQARIAAPGLRDWFEAWWPPAPTQSRIFNLVVALLAALGLTIACIDREWRPFGLVLLLTIAYHALVSVGAEYPTYRYRAVLEPMLAIGLGLLASRGRLVPPSDGSC